MSTPLGEAWALQFTTVPTTPDCHSWQTTHFRSQIALLVFGGEQMGQGGPSPGQATTPGQPGSVGVRTWPQVVLLLARQPPWKTPHAYPLEN